MEKKLDFINGSLLALLLAGGAIVEQKHDGFDFHVIVKMPEAPKDKELHAYEVHETKIYAEGSPFFVKVSEHKENLRVIKSAFEKNVDAEAAFKNKYPQAAKQLNPIPEGVLHRSPDVAKQNNETTSAERKEETTNVDTEGKNDEDGSTF